MWRVVIQNSAFLCVHSITPCKMAKALVFFGNFNLSLRKQFLTLKVGCILTSEEKLLGLFIFI